MEDLIRVKCLKHVYPDNTEVSICGLDFVVKEGERVVILGPNGAGKTTLLEHILGLLSPVEGKVEVMGMRPDKRFNDVRKDIGVVFQNVDEQIIGPTVYDDIAFTPLNDGVDKEKTEKLVRDISKRLRIDHLLDKIPHYLSGGQKKKVALAGAMIMHPRILIMDEPFDSLDPRAKMDMINFLNDINREWGTSLVITTHDINLVPHIADKVYVIAGGRIIHNGSPEDTFSKVDILKEANLEPPVLMELFFRLKRKGYDLKTPHDMDEAEEILLNILKK
ncbi:MAG: ATP-binding cassette domain-containing protein [Xylanivirga thermophila]|jgi:cobalt/nickel transport system ATP-binding protein|uniref:energy-coupling factor ABC transporter ATP-binding protein n=1 Tax=Xylanivirga thermophila TaxID=2496273 RepID=UPI00101BCDB4|nr:ATP-binding cassette domain-containing protein [Xylanivirga thermophila]